MSGIAALEPCLRFHYYVCHILLFCILIMCSCSRRRRKPPPSQTTPPPSSSARPYRLCTAPGPSWWSGPGGRGKAAAPSAWSTLSDHQRSINKDWLCLDPGLNHCNLDRGEKRINLAIIVMIQNSWVNLKCTFNRPSYDFLTNIDYIWVKLCPQWILISKAKNK